MALYLNKTLVLIWNWIIISLNRQLLGILSIGLLFALILCLVIFGGLYHAQLAEERASASVAVNRLLQTSLENAMLKQDLDGLRDIVRNLGAQADVVRVFIANPRGEIRFSSDDSLLGQQWQPLPLQANTHFVTDNHDEEILRSINPVANKPACVGCHGTLASNPINGVLFVDYQAAPIRAKARTTALLFITTGVAIISVTLLTLWWFIKRLVLLPVLHLAHAGQALAAGDWSARVDVVSHNELGALGATFNHMADALQTKLRQINERDAFLQGLLDAIPDSIRVLDNNYQVLKVNRAYCTQLGITDNQALSQPCYQVYQRSQACAPTLSTCPLHEISLNGMALKKFSHYLRSDGGECAVEVFAAPMQVEIDGQMKSLVVESIRSLDKAVQFSHEQKLAAMGQVAAGVAHEIHNPLASLRLALQNTLRLLDTGTCDPPKLRDYLSLVDTEMDKCIEVTRRLLKLTTLGGSQRQPVSLDSAVRETLSLLDYESRERHIDVQISSLQSYRVLAQEHDVRMIIINLAQNAFYAMPGGGTLNIRLHQAADWIQMDVEDNGVGIAPEHLSKIFDPFFSYRCGGNKGTGLGLSICKTLVEQYQGRIEVHSRQGQGACFSVYLLDAAAGLAL
jgi:signal transduction histidine kinase/HAMP domain-containing protein